MGERLKPSENGQSNFTFRFRHPRTHCSNSGKVERRSIWALNLHLATVLAENTRVICEKCYNDYILQK